MNAQLIIFGVRAVLDEEGNWSADNPDLERLLNIAFGKDLYPPSPAAGANSFANQARAAARRYGVKIHWSWTVKTGGKDVVY